METNWFAVQIPCLQFLRIQTEDWLDLQVDDGALPSLRAFTLSTENKRIMIPLRLKSLPPVPDLQEYIFE